METLAEEITIKTHLHGNMSYKENINNRAVKTCLKSMVVFGWGLDSMSRRVHKT